jgi:hypothetical protein
MVHPLKRAEPFGQRGPCQTLLVRSARRACHVPLRHSRDPCLLPRMGASGAPGQPEATLEEDGGAPERGRGGQPHATSRMLLASFMVNTGDLGGMRRAVERREARAQRKARCPHRSRMGHRSRSPGKLGTPGCCEPFPRNDGTRQG